MHKSIENPYCNAINSETSITNSVKEGKLRWIQPAFFLQ
jgi:hypothetical protein